MQPHQHEVKTDQIKSEHTTEKLKYEPPTVTPISVNSGTEGKAATTVEASIASGTAS